MFHYPLLPVCSGCLCHFEVVLSLPERSIRRISGILEHNEQCGRASARPSVALAPGGDCRRARTAYGWVQVRIPADFPLD
ncbi:hypothetical protein V8E36_006484 [Tilletia maclaganii]